MDKSEFEQILVKFAPAEPALRLAWEAVVTVTGRQDLGAGPKGHRFIVPISGGWFRGGPHMPEFHGTVAPWGADRQLLRADGIRELTAEYEMQVADGTIISVTNRVLSDADGKSVRHSFSRIEPTAPPGPWEPLNRRVFLGTLQSVQPSPGYVVIRAWEAMTAPTGL